jgi:hypothetical protein
MAACKKPNQNKGPINNMWRDSSLYNKRELPTFWSGIHSVDSKPLVTPMPCNETVASKSIYYSFANKFIGKSVSS